MMHLVFDSEADGLLPTVTQCWCIVAKDLETMELHKFRPNEIGQGLELLSQASTLVGHNIVGYDFRMFHKLYGWKYTGKVFDTLVASRVLWPDRPLPKNKIRGEEYSMSKYGPAHSIGAWGWRLGRFKPEHEDWSVFSDEMLHRCTEDVEINELVLRHLVFKEARLTLEDVL